MFLLKLKSSADKKAFRISWKLHFMLNFFYIKNTSTRSGSKTIFDCVGPAPSTHVFVLIKAQHKMDATPSFGVSMICIRSAFKSSVDFSAVYFFNVNSFQNSVNTKGEQFLL